MQDAEIVTPDKDGRRNDGGTYLVVADETSEFNASLRYAARMAKAHRGHVCILHVMEIDDFQHWSNVEAIMRKEMRDQAEKFIWAVARRVNDLTGATPGLYVEEGHPQDVLIRIMNEDLTIKMLILGGGGSGTSAQGALVGYFTGKGLDKLRIPVLVVPGHLDPPKIDAIT